jgi:hypothetical protein
MEVCLGRGKGTAPRLFEGVGVAMSKVASEFLPAWVVWDGNGWAPWVYPGLEDRRGPRGVLGRVGALPL